MKRFIAFVIIFVGLILIVVLAQAIDSLDPNSFPGNLLQFFLSLFEIIGFFGIIFFVVFIVVMGGHAVISKDPVEKNLHPETLKRRFKTSLKLLAIYLVIRLVATKFKNWWHDKS